MNICKNCKNSFKKYALTQHFCSPKCNLLFSHIVDEKECWIWNKAKGKDGYGRIRYNKKYLRAHRLSYEIFNGHFDQKLQVLHKCDCRLCINPEHLFLGSNEDNQKDMIKKGRDRKHHKFSIEEVKEIKKLYAEGMTQYKIAKKFKCHTGHIWQIVHNKIWKKINLKS